MEKQGNIDAIIRETVEAAKQEMDFYRELKRRRLIMTLWRTKAELTPQQAEAYQQSNCEPHLREVAKIVLEEIQYNRNERRMAYRVLIYAMVFAVGIMILISLTIYLSVRGSVKHKQKY
ncbi:uncharacterized protein LOC131668227 [Phymastichus coffea]|uniref:uncharacterized protein LOC131668227 n=1 Tax=Phymastichus coffea TaxID=108790 RepID=UPI00273BB372|nr:uncharacterized protein LOC131668227 [Phymastichus coffea]XP_058798179.1 uncharacterized protein LOC131668227 [Phymastichus coffea]